MSKLKAGIFSFGASGRLGPDLVLTRHGQTTIARKFKTPLDARSAEQLTRRDWFSQCIAAWHQLTPAQKEEYRLVNPDIGTNAAYLNFMQEWLHMAVPLHAGTHSHGEPDEIEVQDLESGAVGESAEPLQNLVVLSTSINVLSFRNANTIGWTNLDLSAWVPASAVALLLATTLWDSGSAGASAQFGIRGDALGYLFQTLGPHINNQRQDHFFICLFPGNPIIEYYRLATGAGTSNGDIYLFGWVEPVEV